MLLYIRSFITLIVVALSCTIGVILGIFRPFNPKNLKITARMIGYSHRLMGMKIRLINKDGLYKTRPCVFISNHQDNMDIFPGGYTVPGNTVTIGKRDILYIPFFGLYYWLSGNILINRKNKKSAFATMDIAAETIKNKKVSVWIMPEGTRSRGRGVLPFKKGPFITAIKAGVPVVPIAISSYTKHINLRKWKAGTILVEVLPAIDTTGMTLDDVTRLKDEAFLIISNAVKKLDAEVEKNEQA